MSEPGVLNTAAVSYHEWFLSLQRAGFTEDQALFLVGQSLHAVETVTALRRRHG